MMIYFHLIVIRRSYSVHLCFLEMDSFVIYNPVEISVYNCCLVFYGKFSKTGKNCVKRLPEL